MRKIIASINMTLDGYCDHTAVTPDDQIHQHYNDLLRSVGALIYGRITYQLMESYWPLIVKTPTGSKPDDDFAVLIDNLPKIVYSRTLQSVDWKNSTLKHEIDKDELLALRQQPGKDLLVGSPGMIVALSNLGIIDEYQLMVHPTIIGTGLPLFKNIQYRMDMKLQKTKAFDSGAVLLYYELKKG